MGTWGTNKTPSDWKIGSTPSTARPPRRPTLPVASARRLSNAPPTTFGLNGTCLDIAQIIDLALSAQSASAGHSDVIRIKATLAIGHARLQRRVRRVCGGQTKREGGKCWNLLAIMGKQTQEASYLRLVGTSTRLLAQRNNNSYSETRTGRHIAVARNGRMGRFLDSANLDGEMWS